MSIHHPDRIAALVPSLRLTDGNGRVSTGARVAAGPQKKRGGDDSRNSRKDASTSEEREGARRKDESGSRPEPSELRAGSGSSEGGQARVLVIDDNADLLGALQMILESRGYEVQSAEDGATALAVADDFSPTVVVLDLGLPDVDGRDLCRQFHAKHWASSAKFIALSGRESDDEVRLSREAGFDHHLLKPASPDELDRCIRS